MEYIFSSHNSLEACDWLIRYAAVRLGCVNCVTVFTWDYSSSSTPAFRWLVVSIRVPFDFSRSGKLEY